MKNKNITVKGRYWVIGAALLALFLGALDALIMTTAMPTIIADMGGIHVYSWVYSAYLLARAVSLPIFGKLADLLKTRMLFLISISIFLISSIVAGLAPDMTVLIFARVFQGIGAGGNFALVYIVLADIAPPGKRAKTLSLASSVWGIASVLGPTLGGFIVTYFSWRWVFFINIPTSLLAIALIAIFLEETRPKKTEAKLDIAGAVTLSLSILGLLTLMMAGGRDFAWLSLESFSLAAVTVIAGLGFYFVEKRAAEPILELRFFKLRGFSIGNGSVFLSSFVIFSLFAYAPLFIQGALGKTPMQVGIAMLSLSLGWSAGSFLLGQFFYKFGLKAAAITGAVFLSVGSGFTLTFTNLTSMSGCFWVFLLIGAGMGMVTLSTLLVVQNSLDKSDLGVATTSHQFARSIGGTLGVGICGGLVTAKITSAINTLSLSGALDRLPADIIVQIREHIERLFQPEFQSYLLPHVKTALQKSVGQGLESVFWLVLVVSLICFAFCLCLPGGKNNENG